MTTRLSLLETKFTGIEVMVSQLAHYFQRDLDNFREQIEAGLEQRSGGWEEACSAWVAAGILPKLAIAGDEQVAAVWVNPFFQLILDYGVEFGPPVGVNLSQFIPPPVINKGQLGRRMENYRLSRGTEPYWTSVLRIVFPELYLEPYLPKFARELLGCDLACGWGRASFCLRNWTGRRILGVDLSESGLAAYHRHAEDLGVANRVSTLLAPLTDLALPNNSVDFFLAFDIFEHLTDATLERVLLEILRVARPGAVLYTEIPLEDYFPPITHIQNFQKDGILSLFAGTMSAGKTFQLLHYDEVMPCQFTFKVAVRRRLRRGS